METIRANFLLVFLKDHMLQTVCVLVLHRILTHCQKKSGKTLPFGEILPFEEIKVNSSVVCIWIIMR